MFCRITRWGTERQRGIRTQRDKGERCYPSVLLYSIIPCVLLPSLCVLTITSVSLCVLPLPLLPSVTYSLPPSVFHCVLLPTFVSYCVPRRRAILRRSTLLYREIPYSTERLPFYRETTVLQRNYKLCTDGPNGLPYQGILPRGLYPLASK